jgi:acetyl esterase
MQRMAYPGLDGASDRESWKRFAEGPLLSVASARAMWKLYANGADLREPYLSPLHAETLEGLPPALIAVPGYDHGHDDAVAYAKPLEAAGVPVHFHAFDGLCHGFLSYFAQVSACSAALDYCCELVRAALVTGLPSENASSRHSDQ